MKEGLRFALTFAEDNVTASFEIVVCHSCCSLIVVCCFHCVFGFSVSISGLTVSEHSPNDALQLIQDIRNT